MNAVTITLIIYGGLAFILAVGGIYSLRKGFQLISRTRGEVKENNNVNFLGLKINTGSIGALVMLTSFMWAWAAKLSLPQYQDGNITTSVLKEKLASATSLIKTLTEKNNVQTKKMVAIQEDIGKYISVVEANELEMGKLINFDQSSLENSDIRTNNQNVKEFYQKQKEVLKTYKKKIDIKPRF